ncbi:MAG: MFS transporter, partial [Gammaproteobacteria bacterium]|nr:MFS transporter [Gammaproteobacteria bacterium]
MTIKKTEKRLIGAIVLGNTISWADFALYAYFSPILSKVFFPFSSASESYILYFIVFAIGFLFRPIGSAIAGSYADKNGRKNTLLITVIISSLTTVGIGCLPSYHSIGFFSPLLLTLLRILQTMSISAEPTNSGALIMESSPTNRRGLYASFVMVGVFLGFLLGIVAFLIVTSLLSVKEITAWGWRIPYLASLVIGGLVVLVLITAKESPEFLARKKTGKLDKNPILDSFKKQKFTIWICFGYGIMMA